VSRTPRVVVTGLGVVSPLGDSVPAFWQRLEAGESAVGPISRFDVSGYPTRIAAQAADPPPPPRIDAALWREASRIERFAFAAAAQALDDAAFEDDADAAERGLVLAAGLGSFSQREVFAPCAAANREGEFDAPSFARALAATLGPRAAERRSPGNLAARLADAGGCAGPTLSVDTACAAGTQAIGDALRWLRRGFARSVLVVASDSQLSPLGLASFCLLRALSTRNQDAATASRPFAAGRDGFVMGEGAGAMVLEEREAALRRGAPIHAEVAGFGSACDAYRVTDPHPDGLGAAFAMRRALADAGAAPEEIQYINARDLDPGQRPHRDASHPRCVRRGG
jgi:3-oxoacyl-[acyl-carrier-protein] synthase II